MNAGQYRVIVNTAARMLELADSVHRLSTVDSRLIESEFAAETLQCVAHDLRALAGAIRKMVIDGGSEP